MRGVEGGEEGVGTVLLKVGGADVRSSRLRAHEGRGLVTGDKDAFHTKILPGRGEVRQGYPPIFGLLIDV